MALIARPLKKISKIDFFGKCLSGYFFSENFIMTYSNHRICTQIHDCMPNPIRVRIQKQCFKDCSWSAPVLSHTGFLGKPMNLHQKIMVSRFWFSTAPWENLRSSDSKDCEICRRGAKKKDGQTMISDDGLKGSRLSCSTLHVI